MPIKMKRCKHGLFSFFDNDKWIGKALEQTGEYSEGEVEFLLSLITDESVVVEVGANIGAITVPLAKKAAKVFAFEPQRPVFDLLEQNLVQNCVSFCAEQFIVSDHTGVGAMADVDYNAHDINLGGIAVANEGNSVNVITLDDYCKDFDRLDLLKIDVEGHEREVLLGARGTILRLRPLLYVENDRFEKSHDLIELIMTLGYRLSWHMPPLYNPDPVGRQNFVSFNMLCASVSTKLPQELDRLCEQGLLTPIMSPDDDGRLASQRLDERIAKTLAVPPSSKSKSWACVVRLGGVGDNLVASAVLPYLKEKYGYVEVIACEPQHVIFENNPHVDKLSVKKPGEPPWGDGKSWQHYWADRANEFAFFAHLSHTIEGLRAFNEGQTAFWWPQNARRKFGGQSYLEVAADICDVPYDRLEPNFYPTPLETANAHKTKALIGGRYVAWIISGTRPDKIWPGAIVAIARIIREADIPVVLFGMPGKDFEIAKEIETGVRGVNGSTKNLHLALSTSLDHPNWPIRRSLTQVQAADLVVSPDTGPAWAVAMHDMPKVVMVSHASAENITKHWRNTVTLHADPSRVPCWPCHMLHDTKESCERISGRKDAMGAACITDISIETVVNTVRGLLDSQTALREVKLPSSLGTEVSVRLAAE